MQLPPLFFSCPPVNIALPPPPQNSGRRRCDLGRGLARASWLIQRRNRLLFFRVLPPSTLGPPSSSVDVDLPRRVTYWPPAGAQCSLQRCRPSCDSSDVRIQLPSFLFGNRVSARLQRLPCKQSSSSLGISWPHPLRGFPHTHPLLTSVERQGLPARHLAKPNHASRSPRCLERNHRRPQQVKDMAKVI